MPEPNPWCLILDHYQAGAGYQPFVTHDLAGGEFVPGEGFQIFRSDSGTARSCRFQQRSFGDWNSSMSIDEDDLFHGATEMPWVKFLSAF